MANQFDEVLPRERLSTAKWEMEIDRLSNGNLLCFGTADMDFRSPPVVVDALLEAVDRGHFGYPYKPHSYYAAACAMFASHGWAVQPSWIATNVGIYPSMHTLIEVLTEPDDEIVFQTPVHHVFNELVSANGRVAIENPLIVVDGRYEMDLVGLAQRITERTRVLVLCNPHNPVGRVWTREELAALDEFCQSHSLVVIADEVYYGLTHDGAEYVPFASVSDAASLNSVTVTAASKTFNLTGLKHSLVVTENREVLDAYQSGLRRNNLFYGGSTLGIIATQAAFENGEPWTRALMQYIAANRDILRQRIQSFLPGATVYNADGTYFAWIDLHTLGLSNAELVTLFERDAEVIVSHGAARAPAAPATCAGTWPVRHPYSSGASTASKKLWTLSEPHDLP